MLIYTRVASDNLKKLNCMPYKAVFINRYLFLPSFFFLMGTNGPGSLRGTSPNLSVEDSPRSLIIKLTWVVEPTVVKDIDIKTGIYNLQNSCPQFPPSIPSLHPLPKLSPED